MPGSPSRNGVVPRAAAWPRPAWGSAAGMSAEDKAAHKVDQLAGKAKEALGRATDNRDLEAEGKGDQARSNLKQAGEKIKDAFK
jgi:uncharacterized protein YjbJ (UPF0337 family)